MKENCDLAQRIEDIEAKEANTSRSKKGLQTQIEELQSQLETTNNEKNQMSTQLRAAKSEIESLNEELEMVNYDRYLTYHKFNLVFFERNFLRSNFSSDILPPFS